MTDRQSPASRIDVLIPVYNVESTIAQSIRSILDQTVRDIRVVVIDDGSTDGTGKLLAALAASDPRIIVQRQPNGGIVDALNNGLKLCTSEFLARHDGDDNAFPDRFEKQLAYFDAHSDCVAVAANAFHIDAAGRRTGSTTTFKNPAGANANYIPAEEPYLMHPLLLVRRDILLKAGGYRYVFHAEDADLYWRLSRMGRLHNMSDFLAEYRIHENSVSGKSVVNGRIQAVCSQLAALSERRRATNVIDIGFPRAQLERFHTAKSIHGIMAVAEESVEPAELPRLRLAVAAKLLELASYRPYALERTDHTYIKDAWAKHADIMSAANLRTLNAHLGKYIAKMIKRGNARGVFQIGSPALAPYILSFMWTSMMRRVRLVTDKFGIGGRVVNHR